jgi:hypothetical protein
MESKAHMEVVMGKVQTENKQQRAQKAIILMQKGTQAIMGNIL